MFFSGGKMPELVKKLRESIRAFQAAKDELHAEKEPDQPAELVSRLRNLRKEILRLLDEAEKAGHEDAFVRRLRAAYPKTAT